MLPKPKVKTDMHMANITAILAFLDVVSHLKGTRNIAPSILMIYNVL